MICARCGIGEREYQAWCRPCKQAYDRDYYAANRERQKNNRRKNSTAIDKRNREYVWEYLSEHPCIGCKESDPIVLEFDHIDPSTKKENVSQLIYSGVSLKTLQKEIDKCQILCSNCHKRKTAEQFGWYITKRVVV